MQEIAFIVHCPFFGSSTWTPTNDSELSIDWLDLEFADQAVL